MDGNDSVSLNWDEMSSLPLAFEGIRDNDQFTDVTLVAPDNPPDSEVSAHRIVLAAASPFFRDILYRDSMAKRNRHPVLYIPDVNYWQLSTIIQFIYTGKIEVTEAESHELVEVGRKLKIRGFTESSGTTGNERAPRIKNEHTNSPSSGGGKKRKVSPVPSSSSGATPGPSGIKKPLSHHTPNVPEVKSEGEISVDPTFLLGDEPGDEEGYEDYELEAEEVSYDETAVINDGAEGGAKDEPCYYGNDAASHVQAIPRYGFICIDCNKTYKDKASALRHVQRTHIDSPPVRCRFCQKEYRVEKDRQQHMKTSHGLTLSVKEIRDLDLQQGNLSLRKNE